MADAQGSRAAMVKPYLPQTKAIEASSSSDVEYCEVLLEKGKKFKNDPTSAFSHEVPSS
jgi:hypothetical protein